MNKPKPLLEFYKDTATKDNVYEYLKEFFKEEATRRLMNREDAVAVADAVDLLKDAFENMDIIFSGKVAKKDNTNQAR